jgi:hypothetical protein
VLLALPAVAQDAAGKWNATVETPNGPFPLVFEFAVDGDKLTGSMSNDFMGATPITDGMIKAGELSFKLRIEGGPGGAMTINYKGMVKGDELALTSTFEGTPPGGGPAEQNLTATRAK